jgi:hypothetical protein
MGFEKLIILLVLLIGLIFLVSCGPENMTICRDDDPDVCQGVTEDDSIPDGWHRRLDGSGRGEHDKVGRESPLPDRNNERADRESPLPDRER